MSGAQNDPGIRGSAFPPIGDYAFLSDCETTALIAPNGSVEWLCLPRMDSPSVFAAVLDRDAGSFRVAPADVNVPAGRRYVPTSLCCSCLSICDFIVQVVARTVERNQARTRPITGRTTLTADLYTPWSEQR